MATYSRGRFSKKKLELFIVTYDAFEEEKVSVQQLFKDLRLGKKIVNRERVTEQ